MRAVDVIRTKRDGLRLSAEAIESFVDGVSTGAWPDYQASALLMAIVLQGMTPGETATLTRAMLDSGQRVDLSTVPGPKVGKHSTGGVGDKVSIVLVPLVAACGVVVPKMSGRGLGHTGGTLDKLEAIPGFRTALSIEEFRAALDDVGCAIIGQSSAIVPADRKLYALRDVTATVESIPLIAASVMSKKLAEGSQALVLDVKCGRGAFMKTRDQATRLARTLVDTGTAFGIPTEAAISRMDAPLGRAVGNALEVRECLAILKGSGPPELTGLIMQVASAMLRLAGRAESDASAASEVGRALESGEALERFARMIARQGGDRRVVDDEGVLPSARHQTAIVADRSGAVSAIDAERIGRAAVLLGAGRDTVGAAIDRAAGVLLAVSVGDRVERGQPLMELHHNEAPRLEQARAMAQEAVAIGEACPPREPLILDWQRA